jgi:chromosome segregation ATPase
MSGVSILDVFSAVGVVVAILIALFKTPSERKKNEGEGDQARADAIESYEQTVTHLQERLGNVEKQNETIREQNRCDRDAFNTRVDLLEEEADQLKAENIRLHTEIDALKMEIENYKVANRTLIHENGELKAWAERLVAQVKGLGAKPVPFATTAKR